MMGNPVFVDTMNSLGGNGVAMGFDQLINAMQTGVVDGAENNEPSYESGQHYRYAKYYSKTGHLMIPEILVFSKKIWETLSKEDQALIMKLAKEAQQEQRKLWYEREKESLKKMQEAGVEINEVADKKPFQAAVKPVWDKYGGAACGADPAHPGREVRLAPASMRAGRFHRGRAGPSVLSGESAMKAHYVRRDGRAAPVLHDRRRALPRRHHADHPVGRVHALRAQQRLVVAGADGGAADDLVLVPVRRRSATARTCTSASPSSR